MLIDCDTCTARPTGCADCVVTVLLGAPPGWQSTDPGAAPMTGRRSTADEGGAPTAEDAVGPPAGGAGEFDDVERRAGRAPAAGGLGPQLRHRDGAAKGPDEGRQTG